MKGGPIKGICSHVEAEAKAAGDGWADWRDRRWADWHDKAGRVNYLALERLECKHNKHLRETYGRWVVWAGAEEFYGEGLCMECLQEMMDQLKECTQ